MGVREWDIGGGVGGITPALWGVSQAASMTLLTAQALLWWTEQKAIAADPGG